MDFAVKKCSKKPTRRRLIAKKTLACTPPGANEPSPAKKNWQTLPVRLAKVVYRHTIKISWTPLPGDPPYVGALPSVGFE